MTDADVDGAHIRTLLLTFFFRQMPDLIQKGHLYIAQPPLYSIKKGKKMRYLSTEDEKEKFLMETVLDNNRVTTMNGTKAETNVTLKPLLRALAAAQENQRIRTRIHRVYGVAPDMLDQTLALPDEKKKNPDSISQSDLNKIFGADAKLIDTSKEQLELDEDEASAGANGGTSTNGKAPRVRRADEIDLAFFKSHEFKVLDTHSDALDSIGKGPYRVYDDKDKLLLETDDLLQLRGFLHEISQKGISVQRYKGLGEMNPDQLKETTMDPDKRTVLQVTADDEMIASTIFETLMGDNVEPRKEFIEQHAADVRNLDV